MPIFQRLARRLALALLLPPLLSWVVVEQFLPMPAAELRVLRILLGASTLLAIAVQLALLWWLTGPIRAALGDGDRDPARDAEAARGAHRLPARMSIAVGLVTAASAGAAIAQWLASGNSREMATAGLAVGLASALLGAMLAYALAASAAARAIAAIGVAVEPGDGGTVRGKILGFGLGVLTIAALVFTSASFARAHGDWEERAVRQVEGAQEAALLHAPGDLGPAAVQLVWRLGKAPTALLDASGRIVARAGGDAPGLAPGRGRVEREALGWRITRRVPGGATLVSFLPESVLEDEGVGYWRSLLLLLAITYGAAAVLVWTSAQAMTLPLHALSGAADRMAGGDLSVHPPILSDDEIGRLANDFGRMAQGLSALVSAVQDASRGVDDACRELADIGERVRHGAVDQRGGLGAVDSAVLAMQGSIAAVGRAAAGIGDYARSTRGAMGEMARRLDSARGEGAELEQAMEAALSEVTGLAATGERAQQALGGLDLLAQRMIDSLGRVDRSLSALELAAVASQINAAQAAELSDEAGEVVAETVEGIEALRAAVGDAQQRVTSLGRRAGDIDQIVVFIGEVAGRTNLLSLNASIIAAQAGEHGKAFAVVADQIRDLAAQISASTKSIGDIITAVRHDVDGTATLIARGDELAGAGVGLARRSAESLVQIRSATSQGNENAARIQAAVQGHVDSSRAASQLVGSVAEGSRAVAAAVERIGSSVKALDAAARGVGSLADRVRRALEEEATLGQRQMQSLDGLASMLGELQHAADGHGEATGQVETSLRELGRAAAQHDVAVTELAALASRLDGRARALADRVGRFKTA